MVTFENKSLKEFTLFFSFIFFLSIIARGSQLLLIRVVPFGTLSIKVYFYKAFYKHTNYLLLIILGSHNIKKLTPIK